MLEHEDCRFTDSSVDLDGKKYLNCAFTNCTLVYSGGEPPYLVGNTFIECRWVLKEAAQNTLAFLSALYAGGGRELVENTFDSIRNARKGDHNTLWVN